MSWISKHLGIKLDSHTLGNLVKNLSPVAGTVIGGPLGLAAAGGLSALGDLGRGKNIGQALKGGVENAGLAGAGQALGAAAGYHGGLGALTGGGGESAAGTAASSAAPVAGGAPVAGAPTAASFESAAAPSTGGLSSVNVGGISMAAPRAAALPAGPGWAQSLAGGGSGSGLLSKLGSLDDAAEHHPLATSGVLQGLGGIASSGSENRLRSAQANALETQTGLTANELAQRKASQAALAPYWSALASQGSTQPPIAGNPYTTAGA